MRGCHFTSIIAVDIFTENDTFRQKHVSETISKRVLDFKFLVASQLNLKLYIILRWTMTELTEKMRSTPTLTWEIVFTQITFQVVAQF